MGREIGVRLISGNFGKTFNIHWIERKILIIKSAISVYAVFNVTEEQYK